MRAHQMDTVVSRQLHLRVEKALLRPARVSLVHFGVSATNRQNVLISRGGNGVLEDDFFRVLQRQLGDDQQP